MKIKFSRTRERGPPSALAEIFQHTCLQSRFHQISPFSSQNRVNWGFRGDSPNIFYIGFLIFFFVTQEPMQNSKTVAQTLMGETAHFGFCSPKIGFLGGLGGSSKFCFHWNSNIFVTQEPLQNFKTLEQTLLGKIAHFGFCSPKIGFFGGPGGVPKFYFHWNPNVLVNQEPLQNFKTVAQTLLGETAHFGFCPPQIGFLGGQGGSPKFFSLES